MNNLVANFKQTIQKSRTGSREEELDKNNLIRMMNVKEEMNASQLSRKSSSLIATASLLVKDLCFDIRSVNLEMPIVVQENLVQMLLPYLNAVTLDGYQNKQTRKAFVIGNTGM